MEIKSHLQGFKEAIGLEEEMPALILQYSCLGESHGQRTWQAPVHWVAKSWTWLRTDARKGGMGKRDSDKYIDYIFKYFVLFF